jgi:hypothetical protein
MAASASRVVDADRAPVDQAVIGQHLEQEPEHVGVRLQVDQSAGPADRRVVRGRHVERDAGERLEGQRVVAPPVDPALGVDALEVADQQAPEVDPGGLPRAAGPRAVVVEPGTQALDEGAVPVGVERPLDHVVERAGPDVQVGPADEQRLLGGRSLAEGHGVNSARYAAGVKGVRNGLLCRA